MASKLHRVLSAIFKKAVSRCCYFDLAITRPIDYRPHPLSIQWPPLRHFRPFNHSGQTTIWFASERHPLCFFALPEAYLSLRGTSLFRLSTSSLLPRSPVNLRRTGAELCQAGSQHWCRSSIGVWPVRLPWTGATADKQNVPILKRTMQCLLGAERVGYVFIQRSRTLVL